jgi:hypothetical protein
MVVGEHAAGPTNAMKFTLRYKDLLRINRDRNCARSFK